MARRDTSLARSRQPGRNLARTERTTQGQAARGRITSGSPGSYACRVIVSSQPHRPNAGKRLKESRLGRTIRA
jgi:hypothetical protein